MKKPLFLIIALAASGAASAQTDRVPSGLRPLLPSEPRKANEVTVVLDPPTSSGTKKAATPSSPTLIENASSLPVLEEDETAPLTPAEKKPSVKVRVEKLQGADGPVAPSDVKLVFPFPAKPLSSIPKGWKLASSDSATPFTRDVEVSPGSTIPLSIRPHVLIPDTDGMTTFTVKEPGYDPALGYQQKDTVGAILSDSVRQLEEDSLQMGHAIERLQQLLVSLPRTAEGEEAPPAIKPVLRK
jgi:hypothetical protein